MYICVVCVCKIVGDIYMNNLTKRNRDTKERTTSNKTSNKQKPKQREEEQTINRINK